MHDREEVTWSVSRGSAVRLVVIAILKRNPVVNDLEVLMTVKELSELQRVSQSTLYRLLRQGKIPSFKIGKDWRFLK